ncbi:hypothetical protein BY996DRAFT_7668752 [Phakopsora pachyrhizi]|nr:hypothetical protein BY996DRAFT_7668752 [Phakopsora pachyrhizi]
MSELKLEKLPIDIILSIINHLDISSIVSLSKTSGQLYRISRSDLIWKQISRLLIGPWIHKDNYLIKLQQQDDQYSPTIIDSSDHCDDDWTNVVNYFPLEPNKTHSQLLSNSNRSSHSYSDNHQLRTSSPSLQPICSWYQLATRFLIPNSVYLGWHMCSYKPHGKLILITFDTKSCRFLAEEVFCKNAYDRRLHSNLGSSSMDDRRMENLPSLPTWLPTNQVTILNGDTYLINRSVQSPHQGFYIDLFCPIYSKSPWFTLAPFKPHCFITNFQDFAPTPTLILNFNPILKGLKEYEEQNKGCDKTASKILLARIEVDKLRPFTDPMIYEEEPSSNNYYHYCHGQESDFRKMIYSFKVGLRDNAIGLLRREPDSNYLGARIRYQSLPNNPSTHQSLISVGGRTYTVGSNSGFSRRGANGEEEDGDSFLGQIFNSIGGPLPTGKRSGKSGLEGMWVGCYGINGCEFGKIVMSDYSCSNRLGDGNEVEDDGSRGIDYRIMEFIKVTGDANVPVGEVSWGVALRKGTKLLSVTKEEANLIDFGMRDSVVDGWLDGKGRIALHNFTEPIWIDVRVQLISTKEEHEKRLISKIYKEYTSEENEEGVDSLIDRTTKSVPGVQIGGNNEEQGGTGELRYVNEIRVKWIQLRQISTFFRC